MKEEKLYLRKIPWKHKVVLLLFFITGMSILYFFGNSVIMIVKSVLLFSVLLVASYFDIRFRIIPDGIHVVITLIGVIDFNAINSLTGLLLSPLPFFIMAVVRSGSIGGGDIKLLGACGFALGFFQTVTSSMVGIVLVIVFYSLKYSGNIKADNQSFPFAPFFLIGWILGSVLLV